MEAIEGSKSTGEWNRKDKLNFLKVQKILSAVGIFLSIILATNLFLINGLSPNQLTQNFGVVSIVFGIFSALILFWAIRQTSVIEGSGSENASETDNNFSRFVLVFQIVIFFYLCLYYILYFFAQEQLLNGFPNQSSNTLEFQKYQQTIQGKQTWIQVLSLCTLLISLFTLFTASALAHSTSTHRIAVYVFGLVLLWVCYNELNQLRAVADAFNGVSYSLEQWSSTGLYYRSILTLIFLVLTYLANARRNRLAYLITGAFFLLVVGVTIASTGQVFRDYSNVETYLEGNYLGELGKLSGTIVEGFQCSSKYQKISTLKPAGVCPPSTPQNPADCYLGQNQCPESQLSQIWETAYVAQPESTIYLACLNTNCQGQVTNYYSQFILQQATWALAFVYFSFVLASFTFQLSTKDKGDNLLRTQQYIFFVIFFVALLVIVIVLSLPFVSQVTKNPDLTAASHHSSTASSSSTKFFLAHDYMDAQQTLKHADTSKVGYGQGGCSQFKNFFSSGSAATFQSINSNGVAQSQTQFNNLLDFDTLSQSDNNCPANSSTCGYIYLLRIAQPAAQSANFLYWSSESSQSSTVIDATSVQTLFGDKPAAANNNRYFGIVGSSEVIDTVLQGSSNSLFVCNTQNIAASTVVTARILKVDLTTYQKTSTTSKRVLKMHKSHLNGTAATNTTNGTAAATKPVQYSQIQFQQVSFQVHHLQTGSPVVHAQAYVYVEAGVAPAASTLGFSNYCDQSVITSQVSFQGQTGEDGIVNFFTYTGNSAVTNWNFYVFASHPGSGHTQNCRRYTVSSLSALQNAPAFDIGLGYTLTGQQTRVVLEWDTLSIDRSNWNTQNLNLYTTFQPSSSSKENFNCHVGPTQASCNGVNFYQPNQKFSSQSIDLTSIGNYNYLIYVQRFFYNPATAKAPTDSNWFFSASSASPVLKYYAAASSLPLAVTQILPASNNYQTKAYASTTLTTAAALAWCIQGQTTIQVSPINSALTTAGAQPLGIWSNLQSWSDAANSYPSSNSQWSGNSVC